jgi:hypothetical protein
MMKYQISPGFLLFDNFHKDALAVAAQAEPGLDFFLVCAAARR